MPSKGLTENTVFVRGLDVDVTEDTLVSIFEKIGPVKKCIIVPGRGIAFVQFEYLSDMSKCVEMGEVEVGEKTVSVDEAQKKGYRREGSGEKKEKYGVIIRNIPFDITKKTLRAVFRPCGNVVSTSIHKGYAFVHFDTEKGVEESLTRINGEKVSGREVAVDALLIREEYKSRAVEEEEVVVVEEKKEKKEKKKKRTEDLGRCVFCRGVPLTAPGGISLEERLESNYGSVDTSYYVQKGAKKSAFVYFENEEDAKKCISDSTSWRNRVKLGPEPVMEIEIFPAETRQYVEKKKKDAEENIISDKSDKRNIYLLEESRIRSNSDGISTKEMEIRQRSYEERRRMLRKDVNAYVSTTRLFMRNIHTISEDKDDKENKKRVWEFVQKLLPRLKRRDVHQISVLSSRSDYKAVFVEMTKHEDALELLRTLNNSAKYSKGGGRPIVEFAIEDRRKVNRLRLHQRRGEKTSPDEKKRVRGGDDEGPKSKRRKVRGSSEGLGK